MKAGFRAVRFINVPRGSEVSPRGTLARETGGRREEGGWSVICTLAGKPAFANWHLDVYVSSHKIDFVLLRALTNYVPQKDLVQDGFG